MEKNKGNLKKTGNRGVKRPLVEDRKDKEAVVENKKEKVDFDQEAFDRKSLAFFMSADNTYGSYLDENGEWAMDGWWNGNGNADSNGSESGSGTTGEDDEKTIVIDNDIVWEFPRKKNKDFPYKLRFMSFPDQPEFENHADEEEAILIFLKKNPYPSYETVLNRCSVTEYAEYGEQNHQWCKEMYENMDKTDIIHRNSGLIVKRGDATALMENVYTMINHTPIRRYPFIQRYFKKTILGD